VEVARRYGMRLMGPNGIGVIDTITRLNTTFVAGIAPARGHRLPLPIRRHLWRAH